MNKKLHVLYIGSFFFVGILVTVLIIFNGIDYYTTPLSERFWNYKHDNLKPGGFIGHGLGIMGSLMMIIGVAVYMLRKRVRKLIRLGLLKHWLEFHIFLCSVGPVLVLFHTAFKFGGIVSVSFWSMGAVVLSGIIGRFIYIQIPRSIQGVELNFKEINELAEDLNYRLTSEYNLGENILKRINNLTSSDKYREVNFKRSVELIIKDYFQSKKLISFIKKELRLISRAQRKAIVKTVRNKIVLSRRIGMLRLMQKLFRYWHVAHVPFAIIMFVIMFIHIIVAVTFGYKWIF